jgi:hypothetical protein
LLWKVEKTAKTKRLLAIEPVKFAREAPRNRQPEGIDRRPSIQSGRLSAQQGIGGRWAGRIVQIGDTLLTCASPYRP